jgi:hypothetical protein
VGEGERLAQGALPQRRVGSSGDGEIDHRRVRSVAQVGSGNGGTDIACLSAGAAPRDDAGMDISMGNALIVTAVVASAVLVMSRGDRILPIVALIASGLEALIVFKVITFAVRPVRIDIVLPALLVIAGGACWMRMSTKGQVTAATTVTFVGLIQLFLAVSA